MLPARRRRSPPASPLRLPLPAPASCCPHSPRTGARPPYAPAAASASAGPPTPDTARRTTNSQTRPAPTPCAPPTTTPASRSVAAIPGASRPSPEPAWAPPTSPAPVGTAVPRDRHRPSHPAPATRHRRAGLGPGRRSPLPGSGQGFVQQRAAIGRDLISVAIRRVSCASALSRSAMSSPAVRKGRFYPWLRTASRTGHAAAIAAMIAITGTGDRDQTDQAIGIKRNQ